jgi:hypothetical protein
MDVDLEYGGKKHIPDYVLIQDQNFEGKRLVIDSHQYAHCSFRRCTVVYAGGPFGFFECEFDGYCVAALTGGAIRTELFLQLLAQSPNPYPSL